MKFALTVLGIVLATSTAKFGSEATHFEKRWPEPSIKQVHSVETPRSDDVAIEVVVAPVPDELIKAELAGLRMPEGPPPPPPDVPLEALCHTLASAAQAHGIPAGFFARLIWQESKFKQRVVSPVGAQGVAQFMPAVAAERGLRNPFNAIDSLLHSARFLKEHVDYFGNLGLAAAAYNGGARRVMDWLARRGKLPQETRDYVKSITGHDPESWTEENHIKLAVNLPARAPCEGVGDLSRDAEPEKVAVLLEPPVAKVIVAARLAAAKAAAEAKARLAKARRGKLLAKGRGGATKHVATADKEAPNKEAPNKEASSKDSPKSKTAAKADVKAPATAETKAPAKAEAKSLAKAETKAAAKTEAKAPAKAGAKIAKAETKTAAKTPGKAEAKLPAKIADRAPTDNGRGGRRVAENSAAKR
jgi:hypothetical protein